MIKVSENKILGMINKNDITALKQYINDEIYLQTKIKSSEKTIIKNIQKLANKFYTEMKDTRPSMAGAIRRNGKMILCNPYMIIETTEIEMTMIQDEYADSFPESIPTMIKDIMTNNNYFEIKLDADDILAQFKQFKTSISGLKGKDRNGTIENKGIYVYSDEKIKIAFNINYLVNMVKCTDFNNSIIKVQNNISPMIIIGEKYKGLVVPVRFVEYDIK